MIREGGKHHERSFEMWSEVIEKSKIHPLFANGLELGGLMLLLPRETSVLYVSDGSSHEMVNN